MEEPRDDAVFFFSHPTNVVNFVNHLAAVLYIGLLFRPVAVPDLIPSVLTIPPTASSAAQG